MDLSIKAMILYGAIVLTGLSAGLFYAWSVSVIPGTQKIDDATYLNTMQSINRAILNPAFFVIFFGSITLLMIATIATYASSGMAFGLFLVASTLYLFGTIGVTGLGNVPLNNELEALRLSEITTDRLSDFRSYYESNWNRLHLIRTICAVGAFLLSVLTLFTNMKTN